MKTIGKNEPLFARHNHKKNEEDALVEKEKSTLLNDVFAVLYIVFILIITLAVVIELKSEYQIDIFPGINTPFDDVYFEMKRDIMGEPPPPSQ